MTARVPWKCPRCLNSAQALPDFEIRCTCGAVSRSNHLLADEHGHPYETDLLGLINDNWNGGSR